MMSNIDNGRIHSGERVQEISVARDQTSTEADSRYFSDSRETCHLISMSSLVSMIIP